MELANELLVVDQGRELKRRLADCQLLPMHDPLSRLLDNLRGLEDYVESEQQFPLVEITNILFRLEQFSGSRKLKQFVYDISHMEVFYYRARSLGDEIRNWDPLSESFETFVTLPHVFVWEHCERYPASCVIEHWMLRNSMHLACINNRGEFE